MVKVFIGYDARERVAWQVCAASLQSRAGSPVPVQPIGRVALEAAGLYTRAHSVRDGLQWDDISDAPCSTDFSIARFWVPSLAGRVGWVLFCDCDFLWRRDVSELFALADSRYAVMVVKHQHAPAQTEKMDGQVQRQYPRKNWSSLMLWNLAHAGTHRFNAEMLNAWHRDRLHGFEWLKDSEIGALPECWNWLDGHSDATMEPAAVHLTRGTPDMRGWENTLYAGEWWGYAQAFTKREAA